MPKYKDLTMSQKAWLMYVDGASFEEIAAAFPEARRGWAGDHWRDPPRPMTAKDAKHFVERTEWRLRIAILRSERFLWHLSPIRWYRRVLTRRTGDVRAKDLGPYEWDVEVAS